MEIQKILPIFATETKSIEDMKEKIKMQWLIDKGGIVQDKVFKTRENKGTIMIPTGGGKSGLMMENAIHYIKGNRLNRKMVFVFNGPILRIVAQTVNDFLSVLNGTCKKEIDQFSRTEKCGDFLVYLF